VIDKEGNAPHDRLKVGRVLVIGLHPFVSQSPKRHARRDRGFTIQHPPPNIESLVLVLIKTDVFSIVTNDEPAFSGLAVKGFSHVAMLPTANTVFKSLLTFH